MTAVDDERNEVKVLKRKHAASLKVFLLAILFTKVVRIEIPDR